MEPAPAHEVLDALGPVDGPVSTAQLIELAEERGAAPRIVETLRSLPDREWPGVEEAAADIGTGWQG